ncbi:MAG: glycosyltransferase family 4 protein [Firmicutes bacterium]|jgi:glycogen(starch) synthase|nr:glycosyltransferase family 4 protein [Candidatus Fermentithermobacillaceae bacterium]
MGLKVLMLTWEYPPDHVGGLGRHVCHLSEAMVKLGAEVTVLTRGVHGRPLIREQAGVEVMAAVPYDLHPPSFVTWAAQFNVSLLETCNRFFSRGRFDLIHAHDWIVAYAARALKHSWEVPLVATIHATECGRQKGLHTPMQHHISQTEWWLCYEAWKVITCSRSMRNEVQHLFSVPGDKIKVIPNGIADSWFQVKKRPAPEPMVLYVGRLVPEKGPHVLVQAMNEVVHHYPAARLVIAGGGPMEGHLKDMVYRNGLGKIVEFVGHVGDEELRALYSRAWVTAFPSSYEPFGIVALEAMATGTPCVVGDTGGLGELVEHGVTGYKVQPGNPSALAKTLVCLIGDGKKREELASNGRELVKRDYRWEDIARTTLSLYKDVAEANARVSWFEPARTKGRFASTGTRDSLQPAAGGGQATESGDSTF